ncbi:Holliday junction branch migration protein RuvA [Maribellus sp. CM-23]|uniref:Holliday junction branch migration complex subunit RuvA n=1 Tax=Maribellus luteus TaxID=2305463 RepID=A0A399T3C4_9BACT|nr:MULTISPECIES: Holliday junction branch migration protein RuvA [Maribellus]MCE4563105.1 Holliday junction branch migration protein RuvA [Maribellus sp. CM-23]RIJ48393.1 Holliday junction branch migration protein RuvA [Maribellus luteus]
MYEYIRGNIADISPANIVIEAGGLGYFINISLNSYSQLSGKKDTKLFLHQIVREDAHILYGFADLSERELFRNLISVNGVGASTAIMMLSSLTPDEIRSAVATENVAVLKAVKGIGAKTAQRIIIDLKDKLGKIAESGQIFLATDNTIRNESLSALVMLGFVKKDAEKVVSKILQEQPDATVESVIKQALKRL